MDLRHYLQTLLRRKWQILTITLLVVLVSVVSTLFLIKPRFESTMYFTISARDDKITDYYDFSNYYGTMAAVEFTRALSAWHENPKFQEEVYNKAEVNVNEDGTFLTKLLGPFSVKRIERSNMRVKLSSKTFEGAEKLAQGYTEVLQSRLEHYNQVSDSKYNLVQADRVTYAKETKLTMNIILALLVGLILGIIFAYLYEYFTGVVCSKDQTEKKLARKAFELLPRRFEISDLAFLRSYIEKLPHKHTILAGVDFDPSELTSKLSLNMIREGELSLLIDADLEKRKLHQSFKQTRKAKTGHTDLDAIKNIEKNIFEIEKGKLHFLPVGKGEKLIWEIFDKLGSSRKFDRLLIHTTLPKNAEVLNIVKGANLILIVKLGESKIEDLQKVAEFLGNEKAHLVVLK
ncbi:MAG: Wzz/FepE/Etk N-terminal domain-containing protein [Candidatus Gracilibacteria bacterium]|nr:Wzz/FepE/Etk N-terminal domain-containing protein [Candidatus Gracilibacteria bacterium]